jgi:geranyl-CoA carboxylase alpha subunit
MSFSTILIANRGEIACRIARSARTLGYRTVAVFSDADADAPHVRAADAGVRIGPPPAAESYLNIEAIIAAARRADADAVHPGYGFLSENAAFAEACAAAGLVLIGPPAAAVAAMGNKAAAKRLMAKAGVPTVPGYAGEEQSDGRLIAEAGRIGFPVMVKAAAGGGGRGMRLVTEPAALPAALAVARSEAMGAFGSAELILERALVGARHVEIQVFGDRHGNVIHLGERDCSIQRRHQKIVEEAPSPAVSTELRQAMGEAAVAAARAIAYAGAGTVEFLLAPDGSFYFLEMNTRLQVEHPVTEMVTGLDLVAWQIRIAAGERLALDQHEVRLSGHAIEARLYAEDPASGFLPQSGTALVWRPPAGEGVRVDHGLAAGREISPWYDPMVAKVIAWGANREEARRRLLRALGDTVLLGVANNRGFLVDVLSHSEFAAGRATTAFIGEHFPAERLAAAAPGEEEIALATALWFEATGAAVPALWRNWRSAGAPVWPMRLSWGAGEKRLTIGCLGGRRYRIEDADAPMTIELLDSAGSAIRYRLDGVEAMAQHVFADGELHLDCHGRPWRFRDVLYAPVAQAGGAERELRAPMSGKIVAVLARPGETIVKGQRLVVLEAMKMQHEIVAQGDGAVAEVAVREGDQVVIRQLLVALQPIG